MLWTVIYSFNYIWSALPKADSHHILQHFIWYSQTFIYPLVIFITYVFICNSLVKCKNFIDSLRHQESSLNQVCKYQWPIWLSWITTDSSWAVLPFPYQPDCCQFHSSDFYTWEQQASVQAPLTGFGILSWVHLYWIYCSGPIDLEAWRFWRVASNLICWAAIVCGWNFGVGWIRGECITHRAPGWGMSMKLIKQTKRGDLC